MLNLLLALQSCNLLYTAAYNISLIKFTSLQLAVSLEKALEGP